MRSPKSPRETSGYYILSSRATLVRLVKPSTVARVGIEPPTPGFSDRGSAGGKGDADYETDTESELGTGWESGGISVDK